MGAIDKNGNTELEHYGSYFKGMLYRKPDDVEEVYMLTQILLNTDGLVSMNFKSVFSTDEIKHFVEGVRTLELKLVPNHFQMGDTFCTEDNVIYKLIGFRPKQPSRWHQETNSTVGKRRCKCQDVRGNIVYQSISFLLKQTIL